MDPSVQMVTVTPGGEGKVVPHRRLWDDVVVRVGMMWPDVVMVVMLEADR